MKKYFNAFSIFSVLLISTAMFQVGCKKTKDTIAKVIVRDAVSQTVVSGAKVVLYGQSTENKQGKVTVYDTTVTNASGEAIFNFNDLWKPGQAGVAVLNIDAVKGDASGSGIIKVVEQETSTETVFIQE
ncbi:MAG: hypothetical protein N4A41_10770 [Crocinitomicaceae bacterium]|jgi:hypothetical protein|nr:hypothetical protein [Crocinitomicaceae bacterium]